MKRMLRKRKIGRQNEYRIVLLEDLVPKEHLYLKNVETAADFSFIHGHCKNLYCLDNGRTRDQSTFRLFTNLHGMDAGYHNAAIAHLLRAKGIQGLIGTDATHMPESTTESSDFFTTLNMTFIVAQNTLF